MKGTPLFKTGRTNQVLSPSGPSSTRQRWINQMITEIGTLNIQNFDDSMDEVLPTAAAILKAASSNSSECQAQLLKVVEYGTKKIASIGKRTEQAGDVLVQVWEDSSDLEDALVNVFWLSSSMITSMENEESTKALVVLLKSVVQVQNRPSFWEKLQTNLPPRILEQVGLGSEQELLKKMKVHNTQVHYKQQKYSLFQEESEGYAKLISFLGAKVDSEQPPAASRQKVLRLIGMFELDPNRVLDITWNILVSALYPSTVNIEEVMAKEPAVTHEISRLIDVIKEFQIDKLQALVSFKISTEKISPQLLGTISFLGARDLIRIGGLDESFPNDIKVEASGAYKILWSNGRRKIKNISRLNLGSSNQEDERVAGISQHLNETVAMLEKNPILQILFVLIRWGNWSNIKDLLPRVIWGDLCALMPNTFGHSMCEVAKKKLCPWKAAFATSNGLSKTDSSGKDEDLQLRKADNALDKFIEAIADPLTLTLRSGCIGSHAILYSQICRTLSGILEKHPPGDSFNTATHAFFRSFLLPSLCLFQSNPAIATELWAVLKHLPYSSRYQLYKQWSASDLQSFQDLELPLWNLESEAKASKEIRYLLKRLSRENVREMSRQIAKVAHSNPLNVFSTMLQQIESYDNLVEVMVESQRFVNPLGSDVLVYCILSRLTVAPGGLDRDRLKDDGVNVSQWLQSLEAFTGSFFKRYPDVELHGMICYLLRRLCEGEVMELGLLRTLLKVGGGFAFADYSPAASLSTSQLDGRAGSETLKRQTMSFGIEEEFSSNAAARMYKVFDTNGLGISILLLLAQVQARIIYDMSGKKSKELKGIGYLNDSCNSVGSILLDFLSSKKEKGTSIKEDVPSFKELFEDYNLSVSSTSMFNRLLSLHVGSETSISDAIAQSDKVQTPKPSWSHISKELFDLFVSCTLYDIHYPEDAYSSEITRVEKEIARLKSRDRMGVEVALHAQQGNQRSDASEISRLELVEKCLKQDSIEQEKHVKDFLDRVREQSNLLFPSNVDPRETAVALLASCCFPRSLQSPDDAMYSAHFAFHLHAMDTPGFSTFVYLDELIPAISGSLFGCTEGEAANLAILLWETWKVVNKWRYDEKSFEEEVANKPCAKTPGENGESHFMKHDAFVDLYSKWHASLGDTLMACLKSSEYMHTRAGLVVLARLCGVFPTRPKLGNTLLSNLNKLQDDERARADIRASAKAYATMLLRSRDEGKWVEEDASTAKARKEKDRVAAAERKRKMKEQMQEMDRDSAKIAEETGLNTGSRDRYDGRRQPRGQSSSRSDRENDGRRGPKRANGAENVESGEINNQGAGRGRQGSPPRRLPASRDSGRDRHSEGRWTRGEQAADFSGRHGDRRHGSDSRRRDGEHSNDRGGAWKRGEGRPGLTDSRGKSGKRARPSSPQYDNDARGDRGKRARVEEGRDSSPPRNRRRRNTRRS